MSRVSILWTLLIINVNCLSVRLADAKLILFEPLCNSVALSIGIVSVCNFGNISIAVSRTFVLRVKLIGLFSE
jgi:hypothetical protein